MNHVKSFSSPPPSSQIIWTSPLTCDCVENIPDKDPNSHEIHIFKQHAIINLKRSDLYKLKAINNGRVLSLWSSRRAQQETREKQTLSLQNKICVKQVLTWWQALKIQSYYTNLQLHRHHSIHLKPLIVHLCMYLEVTIVFYGVRWSLSRWWDSLRGPLDAFVFLSDTLSQERRTFEERVWASRTSVSIMRVQLKDLMFI